jgi:hypothetical protein
MKTGLWHHNYKLDPHDSFGFCYLIKNTINGKGYIGKKQYYSYKKKKKHKESSWQSYTSSSKSVNEDIEKYGIDNFYFEILFETQTRAWLTYMEVKLQYDYDVLVERDENGERKWYNGMIGAIKFIPGHIWAEDSKKKLSESVTKMWEAGVFKDRNFDGTNNPMYGRKHTEETKQKWSESRTGVKQSNDHINKRTLKNTGQKRTLEQKNNMAKGQLGKPKPKHICPKCGKTMSIMNAKRYGHYDETCKQSKTISNC